MPSVRIRQLWTNLSNTLRRRRLNADPARRKAFLQACREGSLVQVRSMLAEGMPVNFLGPTILQASYRKNAISTPLLTALAAGHEEVAVELLNAGAKDIDGEGDEPTPVQAATMFWLLAPLKLMIDRGFPVDRVTQERPESALMYAVRFQVLDYVELLLDAGADPAGPRWHGHTPVSYALNGWPEEKLEWLFARFPDPSKYLPDEWSAGALCAGYVYQLMYVRKKGVDLLVPSRDGTDVLTQVRKLYVSSNVQTSKALASLIVLGADTRGQEDVLTGYLGPHFGERLFLAVSLGDPELTQVALDAGADPQEVLEPGGGLRQLLVWRYASTFSDPSHQPAAEETQVCADLVRAHAREQHRHSSFTHSVDRNERNDSA